jgi:hypothetical protein
METPNNTTIENLKEQLLKDIKDLQWNIDYHTGKLAENQLKMQIAEFTITHLTSQEYAEV